MTFFRQARRVLGDALGHLNDDDGWAMASHVALSTLMAVFPFLIFVAALAGFIGEADLASRVAASLFDTWPDQGAAQTIELENILRDDVVGPSLPVEDVLANAPARDGDFIVVPAILAERD